MKTNSPSYKRKPPNSTSVTNSKWSKRRNSPWKKRIRRWVIVNDCIISTTTFIVVIEGYDLGKSEKVSLWSPLKYITAFPNITLVPPLTTTTKTKTNPPSFLSLLFIHHFILIIRKRFFVQYLIIGNNYVLTKQKTKSIIQSSNQNHNIFIQKQLFYKQTYLWFKWHYFNRQKKLPKRLIGRKNKQTNTFFKLTLNKTPNTKQHSPFFVLQFKFIQKNQLIFWTKYEWK